MRPVRLAPLAAAVFAVVLVTAPTARATCGGGGGGGMGGMAPRGSMAQQPQAYVVPWKILKADTPPATTPLTVYWFPSNARDVESSDLNTSRMLTLYSAQCVGLSVVMPDDTANIARFEAGGKQPIALLTGADGKVLSTAVAERGQLRASAVENLIHHELYQRETDLDVQLGAARKLADGGDQAGAVAAYQKVWEQHCLAPKQGRVAQKALKKLGVTVADADLRTVDPVTTAAMNSRITKAMREAFAAELRADYTQARTLYQAAAALDPADPVPARYLGELYRHHTGEWTLARTTFEHLLTIQPDPLSRAVALHGLGKMTIHMGDSAKGLALFEQSIAAYPLPLTYRNMAVYWNSERQRAKADAYVQKALALDPTDGYNLIFAATYLADTDRRAEALKIATDNEGVLAASYNLAAIHALLGNKGKAMQLLKRHFYEYERYDDVRAMEMWEARVDYVFASLKEDAEFVELTKMAR
jgi:tetratricopeptide (TPR) repeat protein